MSVQQPLAPAGHLRPGDLAGALTKSQSLGVGAPQTSAMNS